MWREYYERRDCKLNFYCRRAIPTFGRIKKQHGLFVCAAALECYQIQSPLGGLGRFVPNVVEVDERVHLDSSSNVASNLARAAS